MEREKSWAPKGERTKRVGIVAVLAVLAAGVACSKPDDDASKKAAPAPAEIPTIAISGTPRPAAPPPPTAAPGPLRIEGTNFVVTADAATCAVGQECTMTVRLASTSGYHVNKQYPYKFVATSSPGLTFLGKPEASTFSRESGDFREESDTNATMTVRFKPESKGSASVAGTFKMSVCSDENCQVEQTPIALLVPVS